MLYAIVFVLGVLTAIAVEVLLDNAMVNTATDRGRAKFSLPIIVVLAIVVVLVGWQQHTIGRLAGTVDDLGQYKTAIEELAEERGVDLDAETKEGR